ncbi:LIM domain-containing protein WLIM2b isoform X2 [Actinidia eriantha]|uniref:LIM domain-containing protein WLIM2b isoform X2 n=1 Tax=Actinidia eriantha TaxID=165200 RepID=UPI00258D841D|nr:LIM domain-containing protein WLIM2b isoform X2 [Actinidia eriantha]
MSFTGTQQKCKACEKTVYPVELLSADGVSYHKSCFKCSHCKGTLKLSNYSSMEGVLYCKPHFEQLFKETGSFNKNFQSPAKSAEKLTPELTRSPSKAASMFSGTQEKCATCGKTAYPLEKDPDPNSKSVNSRGVGRSGHTFGNCGEPSISQVMF